MDSRYILFHGKRHPFGMGASELTQYLSSLAVEGNVAVSTQNQALSALLFLYREVLQQDLPWLDDVVRAKRPVRLPVVLTRDEVRAVIRQLRGTPRLIAAESDRRSRRQGRQGSDHDAPDHHRRRVGQAPGTRQEAA